MERAPRRVEVYDNSHIMGTNAIGAMIVAGPEGFVKNQYRTFNIKSAALTPGDDYAMMREVLTRRFSRLLRESAEAKPGGRISRKARSRRHRRRARTVRGGARGSRRARRRRRQLASIAKGPDRNAGRETFFVEGKEPFKLPPRDPALFFVQRLRDEAHRFAIGTHRASARRNSSKARSTKSPASARRANARCCTRSAPPRRSRSAGLADLEKTPGLNAATAQLVYNFFHEERE